MLQLHIVSFMDVTCCVILTTTRACLGMGIAGMDANIPPTATKIRYMPPSFQPRGRTKLCTTWKLMGNHCWRGNRRVIMPGFLRSSVARLLFAFGSVSGRTETNGRGVRHPAMSIHVQVPALGLGIAEGWAPKHGIGFLFDFHLKPHNNKKQERYPPKK